MGGTIENRMRFVTEIYKRTRKSVGDDYPIFTKISAYDHMKNGLKILVLLPIRGNGLGTAMDQHVVFGYKSNCLELHFVTFTKIQIQAIWDRFSYC